MQNQSFGGKTLGPVIRLKTHTVRCFSFRFIYAVSHVAKGLNILTVESLYATYTDQSANVALCRLSDEKINEAVSIALSDKIVADKLAVFDSGTYFINYVLPTEWFAAEIPMNGIKYTRGHDSPADYDPGLYKVILAKAVMRDEAVVKGKEILSSVYLREPIAEVWVDLSFCAVIKVLDMPADVKYEGIPVAIY